MNKYRNVILIREPQNPQEKNKEKDINLSKKTQVVNLQPNDAVDAQLTKENRRTFAFKQICKKAFIIFSRIHFAYRLKFDTLFLANTIFKKYHEDCVKTAD